MSNKYNNVIYIGVTNNIIRRICEHKLKVNDGFTKSYNCDRLVYYEITDCIENAIKREKQLKNWKKEWKNQLVNNFNPDWKDLSQDIGITEEIIENFLSSGDCASCPQ